MGGWGEGGREGREGREGNQNDLELTFLFDFVPHSGPARQSRTYRSIMKPISCAWISSLLFFQLSLLPLRCKQKKKRLRSSDHPSSTLSLPPSQKSKNKGNHRYERKTNPDQEEHRGLEEERRGRKERSKGRDVGILCEQRARSGDSIDYGDFVREGKKEEREGRGALCWIVRREEGGLELVGKVNQGRGRD